MNPTVGAFVFAMALVALCSCAITALAVPLCKRIAFRYDVVDKPGHRKVHTVVKPYLGGAAMFAGFFGTIVCALGVLWIIRHTEFLRQHLEWVYYAMPGMQGNLGLLTAVVVGCVLNFSVGLWDDWTNHKHAFSVKLTVQVVGALLLVVSGAQITLLGWQPLNIVVTVLWVVGITNAFNLLDGMDGLAAGVAAIALAFFAVVALVQTQYLTCALLVALLGTMVGFLFYNFRPASIFMGDAGSLFLGFAMASLTVLESYVTDDTAPAIAVAMPLLILAVPIFDTFRVVAIRFKNRLPIHVGDENHIHHRLVAMGFSQRGAVILIYLIAFACGLNALLLPFVEFWHATILLAQAVALLAIVAALMRLGKRKADQADKVPIDVQDKDSAS